LNRASVSQEAEEDIDQIASYMSTAWGWRQTDRYLDQLEESSQILAQHPAIGWSCDSIQKGLRRYEVGRHVVFYRPEPGGIPVIRVLHQQMVPIKSRFES